MENIETNAGRYENLAANVLGQKGVEYDGTRDSCYTGRSTGSDDPYGGSDTQSSSLLSEGDIYA